MGNSNIRTFEIVLSEYVKGKKNPLLSVRALHLIEFGFSIPILHWMNRTVKEHRKRPDWISFSETRTYIPFSPWNCSRCLMFADAFAKASPFYYLFFHVWIMRSLCCRHFFGLIILTIKCQCFSSTAHRFCNVTTRWGEKPVALVSG